MIQVVAKYNIEYYKNMAKELEQSGAHILAIKDMAGLLKPEAAYRLISELKDTVSLPIHLHSHDTSGNGIYTYSRAIEAGVDIVDTAIGSLAGLTSQPSAQTLILCIRRKRQDSLNLKSIHLSNYLIIGKKYVNTIVTLKVA